MSRIKILRNFAVVVLMMVLWLPSLAQAPGGVPYGEPKPVEFDLFNTIILIVLPVLLIIFFIWYRKRRNKK